MSSHWKGSLLFAAACAVVAAHLASRDVRAQVPSCAVTTTSGEVRGLDLGVSCAFLGIPYAAPPIGNLRWRPPVPVAPWATPLDVKTPPSSCPSVQLPAGTLTGVEDCLRMNIWVRDPLPAAPAPVIVWIHTGSFTGASANFPSHNGRKIAEETGAIVVAPNYRLGALGFLAHPLLDAEDPTHPVSGNYGLLDQRAALQWVHDNIARFGGDPNNVTIAGTSAGGDSVGLHLVSPGSSGLFHRAVIESGTPTIRWPTRDEAEKAGRAFALKLGCWTPGTVLECMRLKTPDQILQGLRAAQQQVTEPANGFLWGPMVDGLEIPDQPRALFQTGLFRQVPTIVGFVRDEGAGNFVTRSFPAGPTAAQYESWLNTEFGPSAGAVLAAYPTASYPTPGDAMARVVGDGQFVCEGQRLARFIANAQAPIYFFSYEYEIDDVFVDRVVHGVESNILFGNAYAPQQFPPHALTPADLVLHAAMAKYWTQFAAFGAPSMSGDGLVPWPLFNSPAGSDSYLVLDSSIRSDQHLRGDQCAFWEPYFFRTMLAGVPASQ
jgi:para-nitrobenzyl esterase